MSEELIWIKKGFIDKELYAPFVVEKDIDYYSDLQKRYKSLVKRAIECEADKESVDILNKYTKEVLHSIRKYYVGDIVRAQKKIKSLIKNCINNSLAINNTFRINALSIRGISDLPFFRARTSKQFQDFTAKEMLALPRSLRGKTGSYRFSIPGLPCLYLSNSSYGCWLETGRPAEHEFNVSPVLVDSRLRLFNLAVIMRDFSLLNDFDKDRVHCWFKLIILMIATSYVIKEENRTFKSEYIVSQLIMLNCKELGLDGVAYYSKRVSDEIFARCAINLALFAPYDRGEYSSLYERVKINSSYNYSFFKQLSLTARNVKNDITAEFDSKGFIINVGNYENQNSYRETYFFEFDKFLLESWNKRIIASSFFELNKT